MRIAYFTAGTHGAGHLVRGRAIAAALSRRKISCEFRIFSPETPWSHIAGEQLERVEVEAELLRDSRRANASGLAQALHRWEPDLLLLDLFWVPLGLVELSCPTWLLLRSVPAAWLVGPREARFDAHRYERIFAMEAAPGLEPFELIPPVVHEESWPVPERAELCARLSLDERQPLRLIVQAGLPSDDALLQAEADRQGGGFIRVRPDALTPAVPWLQSLRGDDRVIAGAGYNLYWESRYFGFHDRMRFVALPRRIDDQAWRISQVHRGQRNTSNGADVLVSQIENKFCSTISHDRKYGEGSE